MSFLEHFTIEACYNSDDGEFYQLRCDESAHDNTDVDQNSTLAQLVKEAERHWPMHVNDAVDEYDAAERDGRSIYDPPW